MPCREGDNAQIGRFDSCSVLALSCVDRRQTLRSFGHPISEIHPAQRRPRPIGTADLPEGFSEEVIVTGITGATAMAVAPDGRVFVCEQTGALRVVKNDALLPAPFVTVKVDSFWETRPDRRGPRSRFSEAPYVYVSYVAPEPYPHHRISRFTADGDVRGDQQRSHAPRRETTRERSAVASPVGTKAGPFISARTASSTSA